MTAKEKNLFKKSSLERISSPEKLNDFIKVSNPAGWMVLAAALVLVVGLLCWGVFGRLTESVTFYGYLKDGNLYCFAPGSVADALAEGMEASVLPQDSREDAAAMKGRILSVGDHPLSYDEAGRDITSDYMLACLGISGWNIPVTVETDGRLYDGVVYSVNVVTDSYRPIEMVFR